MVAAEGEGRVVDAQRKVLGDLVLVDHLAHAQADLIAPRKLARLHARNDRLQARLGGRQQLFSLVGT
ncbi:hypothetical protein D3C87_2031400 [compost metagenome]